MRNLCKPFIILALLCMLAACKGREETKFGSKLGEFATKADPIKVEGQLAVFGSFSMELISNGKLEAVQKASLSFKGTGQIAKIHVENGSMVQSGQLLAELENKMEQLDLEQARLRMERVRLERQSLIVGHQIGAREPEDVSPDALKRFSMQTGFEEAELAYQQALLKFEYSRLTAPISGRIANLNAKEQNVPSAEHPFCLIINDEEFDVVFPVMEDEVSRLHINQEVSVLPFARDSVTFSGQIVDINPLIDANGNVTIKARVRNPDKILLEGMNVKVIIKSQIDKGLIVPKEAVVLRNNQQVVFSLLNGRSYWNYVETEFENSSSYTIRVVKSGILKAGDTIITKGNLNLANDAELDFRFNDNR